MHQQGKVSVHRRAAVLVAVERLQSWLVNGLDTVGVSRTQPSPLLSAVWLVGWLVSVLNIMPVHQSTFWGEIQIKEPLGQKQDMGEAHQTFCTLSLICLI